VVLNRKQQKMERKWKGKEKKPESGNALMRIMERVGIRGEPFIADLTDLSKRNKENKVASAEDAGALALKSTAPVQALTKLPLGLSLYHAEVMQRSKDSYLYHFLLWQQTKFSSALFDAKKQAIDSQSNVSGGGGGGGETSTRGLRTIVFVNAIPAVRRICTTLSLLNVNAVAIHADMQQKQRLKQLDKFRSSDSSHMVLTSHPPSSIHVHLPKRKKKLSFN
jgi:superfamily II DNA/RNA helicase